MHKSRPSLKNYHISRSTLSNISLSRLNSSLSINTTKPAIKEPTECILFPTYALRDPKDPQSWIIRTKGWALTLKKAGPKQKVLKGITKSIAGKISANQLSNKMFENRFKYFLAKGKRNKQFFIEAVGAAASTEWEHDETSIKHHAWNPDLDLGSKNSTPTNEDLPYGFFDSSEDEDDDEEDSDDSDPSTPTSMTKNDVGVTLKSERTGVFSGQFTVPDHQIQKWNNTSCRSIKIKSNANTDEFPSSQGTVHLVEPEGISIISDIDDTIKNTKILSGARAVLTNTFFNPTRAIPGMAEAYSHWYNLGASFHYVSNSPYQLIHVLFSFMRNHHFPPGSLHLRPNTGLISKLRASKRSKRDSICSIIRDFPHRKFVLVGDSGEFDLEIYTRIATEFPGQIVKIFIRDVTSSASQDQSTKDRIRQSKSSSFPSFFTANVAPKQRNNRTLSTQDTIGIEEDDGNTSDEGLDEAASKLAEFVLEPSLTGHGPVMDTQLDDLPDFVDLSTVHQPLTERLMQLHSRLTLARNHLKDIDIILFKDAKELLGDQHVQKTLHDFSSNKD